MESMSYCRFENTFSILRECWDNWDETPDEELSSDHERRAKQRIRKLVLEMAEQFQAEDED